MKLSDEFKDRFIPIFKMAESIGEVLIIPSTIEDLAEQLPSVWYNNSCQTNLKIDKCLDGKWRVGYYNNGFGHLYPSKEYDYLYDAFLDAWLNYYNSYYKMLTGRVLALKIINSNDLIDSDWGVMTWRQMLIFSSVLNKKQRKTLANTLKNILNRDEKLKNYHIKECNFNNKCFSELPVYEEPNYLFDINERLNKLKYIFNFLDNGKNKQNILDGLQINLAFNKCNPRFIDVVLTKKEKEELFESIFKEIHSTITNDIRSVVKVLNF